MSNKTHVILADADGIARAAQILRDGGLVAVPTETVYGLAARADSADAVAKIYAAKGRPSFNPLIVHVRDLEQARQFADFSDVAEGLAARHWPGPLTLVVPRCEDAPLAPAVSAGLPTIALRAPDHPVMCALLAQLDFPLAAPSANRSGFISPTTPAHVLASLDGRIELVLDGGACSAGVESTIVAVRDGGRLEELRPGPVALFDPADPLPQGSETGNIEAPGQLASHYSPGKPVRLNALEPTTDEFMIGFGAVAGDCNLSETGSLKEAAARLYTCLHEAAVAAQTSIAVAPIPDTAEGRAINDRLRRAAA